VQGLFRCGTALHFQRGARKTAQTQAQHSAPFKARPNEEPAGSQSPGGWALSAAELRRRFAGGFALSGAPIGAGCARSLDLTPEGPVGYISIVLEL